MAILKRPMFRKGGSANSGIMDGLDRGHYANGGAIGGGMITGTPMGYRTGFQQPNLSLEQIQSGIEAQQGTQYTEDYIRSKFDKYVAGLEYPIFEMGIGQQVPSNTIKEQSILELIRTQPDKAYEMFKSGEIGKTGINYAAKQEKQAEDLTEAGLKFDKFDFGITPEVTGVEFPGGKTTLPYVPKRKIDDGSLDGINPDDAKETFSEKNKRYLKMMAPGMQKRAINDALAAASTAFGESTGDTKQDIANAISAAAAGMGGTKDIYDKVSMLTLSGEIQKDIEAAKKVRPNQTEALISAWADIKDKKGEQKYSQEEILKKISSTETKDQKFYRIWESTNSKAEAIKDQQKDNPKFWGVLRTGKKEEIKKLPDSAIGMIVYDEVEDSFYKITENEDGEKQKEFVSQS